MAMQNTLSGFGMKTSLAAVGLLGLTACHSANMANKPCQLQKLTIVPADAGNTTYVGASGDIEVRFRNENAPAVADVFPDPVVTVTNRRNGHSCDITDGAGVWSGKSVYLDADTRVLVLNEYSGASDVLAFYQPSNCKRLMELDVSNEQWEVDTGHIRLGSQQLRLDSRCSTQTPKPETR